MTFKASANANELKKHSLPQFQADQSNETASIKFENHLSKKMPRIEDLLAFNKHTFAQSSN